MILRLVSRIFVHINLISDGIKLLLYDCELFFGLDSSFSIGTVKILPHCRNGEKKIVIGARCEASAIETSP